MRNQSGQSTSLMLILSLVLMLTIIFVFNTSKLLSERQQAKMLADQAAYATATRQARLLNLNAYINRTQIANQLAIAQGVSTASWSKYAAKTSQNISNYTRWFPPVSAVFANIGTGLDYFADGLGYYIEGYGLEVALLEKAQSALNLVSNTTIINTPSEFADLTQDSSSEYKVRLVTSASTFPAQIMKQYTERERQRMADVVWSSADPFITNRSKNDILPRLILAPGGWNEYRIHKAGGTELVQLDEWKGVDTLSIHHYYKRIKRFRIRSQHDEMPIGWGSALGSQLGEDKASRSGSYGGASSINPKSRKYSEDNTPEWDVRNNGDEIRGVGIPKFYELRNLENKDPIFPFVVSVKKSRNQLETANRNSNLQVGRNFTVLDNYDALERGSLSNGDMQAITQAEVYFQRPWELEVTGNQINHEYGSLFSPYWKVRLADDMDATKRALVNTETAWLN